MRDALINKYSFVGIDLFGHYANLEQLVKIPLVKRRKKIYLGYIPKSFKRKQKPIL